ncbi:MAG TPA: hypothetical protein VGH99_14005 [Pseudonocardia sp.]|jgi:hypothetical protein
MSSTTRRLSRVACLAAVAVTSLIGTAGTAAAASPADPPPWAGGDSHENDTRTAVHSAGPGSTAVNAAGGPGYAYQQAQQQKPDTSQHTRYENNSRTDSHNNENSHNSSATRDSHNTHSVQRPGPGPGGPGPG